MFNDCPSPPTAAWAPGPAPSPSARCCTCTKEGGRVKCVRVREWTLCFQTKIILGLHF